MRSFLSFLLAACLVAQAAAANAAGGAREYKLDWPERHEVLAYHSCGCADTCWVAEVRNRQSRQRKARLRCDCEKAFYALGARGAENPYSETCDALNTDQKPAAIRRTMRELLHRPN